MAYPVLKRKEPPVIMIEQVKRRERPWVYVGDPERHSIHAKEDDKSTKAQNNAVVLPSLSSKILDLSPFEVLTSDTEAIRGVNLKTRRENTPIWQITHPINGVARAFQRLKLKLHDIAEDATAVAQTKVDSITVHQRQSRQDTFKRLMSSSQSKSYVHQCFALRSFPPPSVEDLTLDNMEHYTTLNTLLYIRVACNFQEAFPTFNDWVVLLDLPRTEPLPWLKRLRYHPNLHAIHRDLFPVSDVVRFGLNWKTIKSTPEFWVDSGWDTAIAHLAQLSAVDWLNLGFQLDDLPPTLAREAFMKFAYHGAWSLEHAQQLGFTNEWALQNKLSRQDLNILVTGSGLCVPPLDWHLPNPHMTELARQLPDDAGGRSRPRSNYYDWRSVIFDELSRFQSATNVLY